MARPSRPAGLESRELPHDRVGITHDAVRPTREGPPRDRVVGAVHEALRIRRLAPFLRVQVGQIADRSPVGVIDDVLEVVVGLPLSRAADDADRRPHLDVAAALARQSLGLGDTGGAGLRSLHRVEVQVRVADRERAPRLGAPGVHHQRVRIAEGPRCAFHAA